MMITNSNQTAAVSAITAYQQGKNNPVAATDASSSDDQKTGDRIDLSETGKQLSRSGSDGNSSTQQLSQQELDKLRTLKLRDTEVRMHEQAHISAAGSYAKGGPSFTYQKGPDGNSYAIGGEVGIDLSSTKDPAETIQKMQTIKRAALAPANPSPADRQIAAQASVKEAQARQDLSQELQEELSGGMMSENQSITAGTSQQRPESSNSSEQTISNVSTGTLRQRDSVYRAMLAA